MERRRFLRGAVAGTVFLAMGGATYVLASPDDPRAKEYETLLSIDSECYDFAFHPDFANNGFLYVGNNGIFADQSGRATRVTRYTLDRATGAIDARSATTIIEPSGASASASLGASTWPALPRTKRVPSCMTRS